jgi:hypothetical protein
MTRNRRRIDEGAWFRARRAIAKVSALCIKRLPVSLGRQNHIRYPNRIQPRRVDNRVCRDCRLLAIAHRRRNRAMERADSTGLLERALEELHQTVRVHNARRRALEHAGFGTDVGFAVPYFGGGKEAGGDADGRGEGVDFGQGIHLRGVLGHDPFPSVAVGDRVFAAEVVHHFLAAEAELGLEGVGTVVEASVDDLVVLVRCGFVEWW